MNELQDKVVTLQKEKSGLAERLAAYKQKLDSQEHSLSLTRDEREELLQVKVGHESFLNTENERLASCRKSLHHNVLL